MPEMDRLKNCGNLFQFARREVNGDPDLSGVVQDVGDGRVRIVELLKFKFEV